MNKKNYLIVILVFHSYIVFPQLIDNKLNVYIGYCKGNFSGNQNVNVGSFISPSLYSSYTDLTGMSIKTLIKRNKYFSLGLSLNGLSATGWINDKSSLFNNSIIKQYSLSPTIQIHNRFTETGIMNRIRLFAEIAPNIGLSELKLENPVFDVQGQSGIVSLPMNSQDTFYGIKESVGFDLSISRVFGVYFSYSIQQNWVKSKLYNDTRFSYSNIGLGLVIRLIKDKHFYY